MTPQEALVKLPIIVRDGDALLSGGLPLPRLRHEVEGELWVQADTFADLALFRLLSHRQDVELLPKDAEVLIGISASGIPPELAPFTACFDPRQVDDPAATDLRWVAVKLKEPVSWPVTGATRPLLSKAQCFIPALNVEATSLNHAFTTISRAFEPNRMANTGDAFERVYYQDGENHWAPLDQRRRGAQRTVELRVRFPSLLKAFGLGDARPEPPQPTLFGADMRWWDEAAARLAPYAGLLAVAHEVHRNEMIRVQQTAARAGSDGFWEIVRRQADFAGKLTLKRGLSSGFHRPFAALLCLTQEGLDECELLAAPACEALLAYTGDVLEFVWKHGPGRSAGDWNLLGPTNLVPSRCDLCGAKLPREVFYVDGAVSGAGGWANMCLECFAACGEGIDWGVGQLFVLEAEGNWEPAAGGPPS